jgi:predicted kinase
MKRSLAMTGGVKENLIVHINGWPGSGKLTIARILARSLGARLLHNHIMLNPAEALFERSDPLHGSLHKEVRAATLDHAARLSPGVSLVFTDALGDDSSDRSFFDGYRHLAERRSARLVAVVIACDPDENIRRLTTDGRAEQHKLTNPEVLARLRADYQLLRPEGIDLVELNVTRQTAAEAAAAIEALLPR